MKVEIKKLPKGFKVSNGKVVRSMAEGGTVNNSLGPMNRNEANLEAEKGETALTDLTNDGSFELYNIGGKRHTEGGTPLNLPEQSFVFSDTRKMNLSVEELKSLGIESKKKMTPAAASKRFPLNKYIEILEDETSDKIAIATAEDMINKNKIKLSQISFMQESKKDFSNGLPLAAYPFLIENGIDPKEFEAKIQEQQQTQQGPPQQSQQQMAMGPQQGNLQQFTGPPQGMPPMNYGGTSPMTGQPMVPQMGVPEGYVRDQNPLGLPGYKSKGERGPCSDLKRIRQDLLIEIRQAESPGIDGTRMGARDVIKGIHAKLQQVDRDIRECMQKELQMQDHLVPQLPIITPDILQEEIEKRGTHTMPDGTVHPGETHEEYLRIINDLQMHKANRLKIGGDVGVCPTCGKKLPCGCKYKMGGGLPRFQGTTKSELVDPPFSSEDQRQIQSQIDEMQQSRMTNRDNTYNPELKEHMPLPQASSIASRPRSFFGNIGTRFGNIFRSDEKDIDPTQVMFDSATGKPLSRDQQMLLNQPGEKMHVGSVYKYGGSPFKNNSLRKFTDGGAQTPFSSNNPIDPVAQQGRPSDAQIALQNILKYRQDLVEEYQKTASYIQDNPNVLEDPEKAYELQASIKVMEQQLNEIDVQTQAIEAQMMQERVQMDPFSDPSAQQAPPQAPAMARYGVELPKAQEGLTGQDAWAYQGMGEGSCSDGVSTTEADCIAASAEWYAPEPILGHRESAYDTYDPEMASGQAAHQDAYSVMASADFDPPRKLWLSKYREAAAANNTGANAWVSGKSDAELFYIFNRMNEYLSTASADGHTFAASGAADDATAKKYGWGDKAPTSEEVKIFQGMYASLNDAKMADESGLLDQIVTTPMGKHHTYTAKDIKALKANGKWTDQKVGDNKMVDANGNPVSYVDGKLGWTTGGQHYKAENKQNTSSTTVTKTIPCPEDVRQKVMKRCVEEGKRFDQSACDCAPITGDWTTPKYPDYETFPQDDLLVATKSAQLAGLEQINPVMEPTFDPMLVNPHYVDPRQALSSIEASGAAAMNANPDQATYIMGKMQDMSEKVINQHESLNTKIYNNAQNINIPLINNAAEASADNFKTYFDETNMARENYNVGKMELTDNLVNSVNTQMSNADEMYIRNLENPNYWYSPQAHNVEYYNARDLDGKTRSTNPLDQELANYEYLQTKNPDFAKIYYDKMYGKKNDVTKSNGVDVTRPSEEEDVTAKHGLETKRMKNRQAELLRSKRKLRKWILGYK